MSTTRRRSDDHLDSGQRLGDHHRHARRHQPADGRIVTPRLVLVDPGHPIEYRGRLSYRRQTITIDRKWDVFLGDELIGRIEHRMFTRETRSKGKRYVNSRWQSPGWAYIVPGSWRGIEAYTRKDAIRSLVDHHERRDR